MRKVEAEWASKHDWFVSSREVEGIWFVTDKEIMPPVVAGGEYVEQLQEFKWFEELRAWAGY